MTNDTHPYEAIARDCLLTVELTAEQSAAVLRAYDYGLESLTAIQRYQINVVIAKLKDQIWP